MFLSWNNTRLSIIMPVFNMEGTMREAIDSAVGNLKAVGESELIVVDDGSGDSSLEIAWRYAEQYPFVKVFTQRNLGSGAARNFGLSVARGEFVGFLDADDLYPRDTTLLRLYATAKAQDAEICGGSFAALERDGSWFTGYRFPFHGERFTVDGYVDYGDYQYDFSYQRFIYRRRMLMAHGIGFPDLLRYQDVPFFVRAMIAAKRFYALREVSYVYRRGCKSIRWTGRRAVDLLRGLSQAMRLARAHGYHGLYHLTYLRYLGYAAQSVFLGAAAEDDCPPRVLAAWLGFVRGLDHSILARYGVPKEEISVRHIARMLHPYASITTLLNRAERRKPMTDHENLAIAEAEEKGAQAAGNSAEGGSALPGQTEENPAEGHSAPGGGRS